MSHFVDAALFLLFSLVLGAWSLAIAPKNRGFAEALALPALVFLGFCGFAIWAVGSLFAFNGTVCAAVFVFTFAAGIAARARQLQNPFSRLKTAFRGAAIAEKAFAFYLFLVCAAAFVLTLAPPTGNDYDSLVYHLAVPAQYLREGRIIELRFDHHAYFPFALEMLFGAGLAWRGAIFAKLFHWLMLPLCAALLVALGARFGQRKAGFLAAALFVSMPLALVEASTAYVDLGFTAFVLGAVWCFLEGRENPQLALWRNGFFWSGVFCGFALGTKYFGGLITIFLGFWLLVEASRARRFASVWRFALPVCLLGLPWYIRNEIWVGNPVFPFAYEVFGGQGWTLEMARAYAADQAQFGFGRSIADLVLLPWRLSMTPLSVGVFDGVAKGQPFWPLLPGPPAPPHTGFFDVRGLFLSSFIGPAFLALGVPALFVKNKPRGLVFCLWFFAFLWAFWALTSQQIRYLFPALALWSLVCGFGAIRANNWPLARFVLAFSLGAWLLFSPFLHLYRAQNTFAVISGAETQTDFLRRTFAGKLAMEWANQNTPPNARFAVYGEPRCFYLERAYFWADAPHNRLIAEQTEAGKSYEQALKTLGATHVLVNTTPGENGGVFGPSAGFLALVENGEAVLRFEARGYQIYELVGES